MPKVINKPFLKWAGAKTRLTPRICKVLPSGNVLIEPFIGSGAVFLNTDYPQYILADINPDLINLYKILQKEQDKFIKYASKFFTTSSNNSEVYYQNRELFNKTKQGEKRAALFIYLNRHGYNGLCRYNKSGLYNVPFGRYKKPYFPAEEMSFFAKKSSNAIFVCKDFADVMEDSVAGDVIYCDPPYVPVSDTSFFTQYAHQDFAIQCQQRLVELARKISAKGTSVVISNHDNKLTRELYQDAKIESFLVQRYISCKGSERKKAKELLAIYP